MGLQNDIGVLVTGFKGDEVKFKGVVQALMFTDELSIKDYNDFAKIANELEKFCKTYKESISFFSKKKAEHLLTLESALTAYKEQSALQRKYMEAARAREKLLLDYEDKLQEVYQNINTKIDQFFQQIELIDEETGKHDIKEMLYTYVELSSELSLKAQEILVLKKNLSVKFNELKISVSFDSLLEELEKISLENYASVQKEKTAALVEPERAVKAALDAWGITYKQSPLTWVDWEAVVAKTLREIEDKQSPLWNISENIQKKMRAELETSYARANDANVIADTHRRKFEDLEKEQQEFEARSATSKNSRSSRGTNAGDNFRFSGEEVDPMDDFQRLCRFWHPSRVLLISIFSTQLREFSHDDNVTNTDPNQSAQSSIQMLSSMEGPLRSIVLDLIKEKLSVYQAIKMFTELPGAQQTLAYSKLMQNILSGLIQLNTDMLDLHPGFDAQVSSDEQAYYRSEKLATICEASRDNGAASLLPFDLSLASQLEVVCKQLAQNHPNIEDQQFQRKCTVSEVKQGAKEFKVFTHQVTLAIKNIQSPKKNPPVGSANLDNNNPARMHIAWDTPGREVTKKMDGSSLQQTDGQKIVFSQ